MNDFMMQDQEYLKKPESLANLPLQHLLKMLWPKIVGSENGGGITYTDYQFLQERADFIGSGCTRCVFAHKNSVIKVAKGFYAVGANRVEVELSQRYQKEHHPRGIVFARCRPLTFDCAMIVMERVTPYHEVPGHSYSNAPDWAHRLDGLQYGYNRKGKAVAYDFGDLDPGSFNQEFDYEDPFY